MHVNKKYKISMNHSNLKSFQTKALLSSMMNLQENKFQVKFKILTICLPGKN